MRIAKVRGSSVSLQTNGAWLVLREVAAGETRPGRVVPAPLSISVNQAGWSIRDGGGLVLGYPRENKLRITPVKDAHQSIGIAGRVYDGEIACVNRFDARQSGFDVVNRLPMEKYLPGVLERELFPHWSLQTYLAQAVAARSYAWAESTQSRDRPFDLVAGQASQMYVGLSDNLKSLEAVERTRGEMLGYDGGIVPAYYASCCGGIAANAIDAISPNPLNNIRPLQTRSGPDACTEAPVYRWHVTRSASEFARRLVAYARAHELDELKEVATIQAINPGERNVHGRPTSYEIIDVRGNRVQLDAGRLRRAGNFVGEGMSKPKHRLRSAHFEVLAGSGILEFAGRGYGHGVGLCQYGAEALASRGADYRRILNRYYPQASLIQTYFREQAT